MKARRFKSGAAHPLSFTDLQARATDRAETQFYATGSLAQGWHTAGAWVWCSITMGKHFMHSPNTPHRSGAGDLYKRSQEEQASSFEVRITSSAVVKSVPKSSNRCTGSMCALVSFQP